MAELKIDNNYRNVVGGITNDASQTIEPFRVNPATNRLLVENSALDYTLDSIYAVDGFHISNYDYIALDYTSGNLTQVLYKTGGSSGTAVGTLTLAYSGGTLTSVTLAT